VAHLEELLVLVGAAAGGLDARGAAPAGLVQPLETRKERKGIASCPSRPTGLCKDCGGSHMRHTNTVRHTNKAETNTRSNLGLHEFEHLVHLGRLKLDKVQLPCAAPFETCSTAPMTVEAQGGWRVVWGMLSLQAAASTVGNQESSWLRLWNAPPERLLADGNRGSAWASGEK